METDMTNSPAAAPIPEAPAPPSVEILTPKELGKMCGDMQRHLRHVASGDGPRVTRVIANAQGIGAAMRAADAFGALLGPKDAPAVEFVEDATMARGAWRFE